MIRLLGQLGLWLRLLLTHGARPGGLDTSLFTLGAVFVVSSIDLYPRKAVLPHEVLSTRRTRDLSPAILGADLPGVGRLPLADSACAKENIFSEAPAGKPRNLSPKREAVESNFSLSEAARVVTDTHRATAEGRREFLEFWGPKSVRSFLEFLRDLPFTFVMLAVGESLEVPVVTVRAVPMPVALLNATLTLFVGWVLLKTCFRQRIRRPRASATPPAEAAAVADGMPSWEANEATSAAAYAVVSPTSAGEPPLAHEDIADYAARVLAKLGRDFAADPRIRTGFRKTSSWVRSAGHEAVRYGRRLSSWAFDEQSTRSSSFGEESAGSRLKESENARRLHLAVYGRLFSVPPLETTES